MMLSLRSLSLPLAVSVVFAGPSGVEDRVVFGPDSGLTVTKSFEMETTWVLDTMEMTVDGAPLEMDMPESQGLERRKLVIEDEYVAMKDAHMVELRRGYDTIDATTEFTVEMNELLEYRVVCESDLEGENVRFRWDEDAGEYTKSFGDEEGGDPDLLEPLRLDASLRGLLPDFDVAKDDTWEVDTGVLLGLFAPGGAPSLLPEEVTPGSAMSVPTGAIVAASLMNLSESAVGEIDGEITATYTGSEKEAGRKVARIEIEVDVTLITDKTERYRDFGVASIEDVDEDAMTLEDEIELEAKGELLWDLEERRVAAFSLEGEIVITAKLAWHDDMFGEPIAFTGEYEASGTAKLEVGVE